jgi:hypothetical protein
MFRTPLHALLAFVPLFIPRVAAAQDALACCADLEERIAELEQTPVTKGNRKVSLMISGQVNKAMTFWDDGEITDAYVVDNDFAQSRIRFQGKAEFAKGWEVGYWLELGFDTASSDSVSQFDANASAPGATAGEGSGIELRPARWYIKSEEYGQLWVGRGSTSQDNLYKWANLGRAYSDAELHYNGRFALRRSDGAIGFSGTSAASVTRIWDDVANNLDLSRTSNVRYDTPTIAGFMLSASYNPGISDVALRYTEKFGTYTVNWGIGYLSDTDTSGVDRRTGRQIDPANRGNETKDIVGSAGLMEKDSGIYVYTAFGWRKFDDQGFLASSTAFQDLGAQGDGANYFYVQTGINRDFISMGSTNLHVDFGVYEDWLRGSTITFNKTQMAVTSSTVTRWGFGVTQAIKAAEADLYAIFNHYSLNLDTADIGGNAVQTDMDDWMAVTAGMRVNF